MAQKPGELRDDAVAATPRLDGVDILRGLSILAVILLHISIRMMSTGFSLKTTVPPWLFQILFWNGNNGVTVFFAISGFLITTTSLRRFGSLAAMSPARFYRIRFARIMPSLLLILATLSALHLLQAPGFTIVPQRATLPRALVAALTFHLNWLEAARGWLPPNWDVLWSLSVEEMFYLAFPLVCILLLRFRRGKLLFTGLLLILVAMGPFQRVAWTSNKIWQEKAYLGGMDGIALGCLCALLTDRLRRRSTSLWTTWSRTTIALAVLGSAMIALIFAWPEWSLLKPAMQFIGRTGIDGTILPLGACFVIMTTSLTGLQGSAATAPIRWLGRHSYEIYLTHEFIIVWGTQLHTTLHRWPLPIWFTAIALLAVVPGAILARYFSEPLNRSLRGRSCSLTAPLAPEIALAETAR